MDLLLLRSSTFFFHDVLSVLWHFVIFDKLQQNKSSITNNQGIHSRRYAKKQDHSQTMCWSPGRQDNSWTYNRSEMTYIVSGEALNSTHSLMDLQISEFLKIAFWSIINPNLPSKISANWLISKLFKPKVGKSMNLPTASNFSAYRQVIQRAVLLHGIQSFKNYQLSQNKCQ